MGRGGRSAKLVQTSSSIRRMFDSASNGTVYSQVSRYIEVCDWKALGKKLSVDQARIFGNEIVPPDGRKRCSSVSGYFR